MIPLIWLDRKNRSIGLGRKPERAGMLAISLQVDVGNNRIVRLGKPVKDNDAATKGYVDEAIRKALQKEEA